MSLIFSETNTPIAYDISTENILYYCDKEGEVIGEIGNFEIIPNTCNEFENIYVVGASGSGKSYFAASYALNYRRVYPKNNIFIFSQKDRDEAFEKRKSEKNDDIDMNAVLKVRRVKIDESFIKREIDITKDFKNCLIIFDDFLYYENKVLREKICNIITQILNLGRSNKIYCVITAHLLYQMKNRDLYMNIHNEVHKLVWFKGANMYQLKYCLKNYWGLSNKCVTSLMMIDGRSRWTCLNRYPNYVLTHYRCLLLT